MFSLSQVEVQQVSGGDVCVDGLCFHVSNAGIPANAFNVIETNFQNSANGYITNDQAAFNIVLAGAEAYFATYMVNFGVASIYFV